MRTAARFSSRRDMKNEIEAANSGNQLIKFHKKMRQAIFTCVNCGFLNFASIWCLFNKELSHKRPTDAPRFHKNNSIGLIWHLTAILLVSEARSGPEDASAGESSVPTVFPQTCLHLRTGPLHNGCVRRGVPAQATLYKGLTLLRTADPCTLCTQKDVTSQNKSMGAASHQMRSVLRPTSPWALCRSAQTHHTRQSV